MELLFLIYTTGIALTVLLVFQKYDLFNYYEMRRKLHWPQICILCFGFWTSVLISIPVGIVLLCFPAWHLVFVPFAAAGIVNKLFQ